MFDAFEPACVISLAVCLRRWAVETSTNLGYGAVVTKLASTSGQVLLWFIMKASLGGSTIYGYFAHCDSYFGIWVARCHIKIHFLALSF